MIRATIVQECLIRAFTRIEMPLNDVGVMFFTIAQRLLCFTTRLKDSEGIGICLRIGIPPLSQPLRPSLLLFPDGSPGRKPKNDPFGLTINRSAKRLLVLLLFLIGLRADCLSRSMLRGTLNFRTHKPSGVCIMSRLFTCILVFVALVGCADIEAQQQAAEEAVRQAETAKQHEASEQAPNGNPNRFPCAPNEWASRRQFCLNLRVPTSTARCKSWTNKVRNPVGWWQSRHTRRAKSPTWSTKPP